MPFGRKKTSAATPTDQASSKWRLYRALYILSFLGAIIGLIIGIGALAALQAYCSDHDGIVAGLKSQYRAAASFAQGVAGGNDCDTRWRFEWWAIALEIFFLVTLFVIYKMRRVWKYKSALFALGAIATTLHMMYANELLIQSERTQGTLKERGTVAFVGFCLMAGANILLSFFGSALYETRRPGWFKNDPKNYDTNGGAEEGYGTAGTTGVTTNTITTQGVRSGRFNNPTYEASSHHVDIPADEAPERYVAPYNVAGTPAGVAPRVATTV